MSQRHGAIAIALITGHRLGLSQEDQEALRRSGLAHVLAISGLHMALITLTIIALLRWLVGFSPALLERHPVKKWALGAGFVGATFYLFISGGAIATQRAWIMISVMLLAGLANRQSLTMRNVALAACIILLLSPNALFQPGFQMSFAATAALVAAYRSVTQYRLTRMTIRRHRGMIENAFRFVAGTGLTSLVAGLATAFFAAWHFHRIAPAGLFANLLAMPVFTLFVMPLALVSLLLMPYGLEGLALVPLDWSIASVLAIAQWINQFGLDFETGRAASGFIVAAAASLFLLCAFETRLRWLTVIPAITLLWFALQTPQKPDILIAEDGRAIGFVARDNDQTKLVLPYPARGKFHTQIWQRAFAPNSKPIALEEAGRSAKEPAPGKICDREQCDFKIAGRNGRIVFDPALLAKACIETDILLAPRLWWVRCHNKKPEIIVTRSDLERLGSHMINLGFGGEHEIETARNIEDLTRPWNARWSIHE